MSEKNYISTADDYLLVGLFIYPKSGQVCIETKLIPAMSGIEFYDWKEGNQPCTKEEFIELFLQWVFDIAIDETQQSDDDDPYFPYCSFLSADGVVIHEMVTDKFIEDNQGEIL